MSDEKGRVSSGQLFPTTTPGHWTTRVPAFSEPRPGDSVSLHERYVDAALQSVTAGDLATDQAANIFATHLPQWAELFARKNRQYAGLESGTLGAKGMFVDVWRKVHVLKRVIWEDGEPATETTREVIMDLIGHLFLILDQLDRK